MDSRTARRLLVALLAVAACALLGVVPAASAQADTLTITVDELVDSSVTNLPVGRVRIKISTKHPTDLDWSGRRVYWFMAKGTSDDFKLVRKTHTTQGTSGVTRLKASFAVPAGYFRFFACFSAPGRRALNSDAVHERMCEHGDFTGPSSDPQ